MTWEDIVKNEFGYWRDEETGEPIRNFDYGGVKQRSDEQQLRMDILDFADDTMSRILVDFRKMFKDDTLRGDDSHFLDFRQKLREFALDYAGLE